MKENPKTGIKNTLLAAGLIYGNCPHYIDHLAPLCHILNIPLLVSDPLLLEYQEFYPETAFLYESPISFNSFVFDHFEVIFSCYPRILLDSIFAAEEITRNKKISSVWCSHGLSDKGRSFNAIDALKNERYAMFYGKRMLQYFNEVCSLEKIQNYVLNGNYRLEYYKKFSSFYQSLIQEKFGKIISSPHKTLLYAPTWNDIEGSCSIKSIASYLTQELPEDLNLIIKPHPLTALDDLIYLENLISDSLWKERITVVENFTPIYPLLALCDYYLGDMSSIGYDFLYFDRPLFFINHNQRDLNSDPGLHLHHCGISVTPDNFSSLYNLLKGKDTFSEKRKSLYQESFEDKSLSCLRQDLEDAFLIRECKADLLTYQN